MKIEKSKLIKSSIENAIYSGDYTHKVNIVNN